MQKIILYYKFTPITDPEAVRLWQKALCQRLNLRGRIILSKHGINGTLGGEVKDLKSYAAETKTFQVFKTTDFKWGEGGRDNFPKLSVKVRDEIVTFGASEELKVDADGVINGGKRLKPAEVHKLVQERGDDVVFFDGRSRYEAAVGKFKGAVVPDVRTAKDFIAELDSHKYDDIKNKPVVTYCTGGIRCEILSSLMKNRGFTDVYQMDGGIVKYGQTYADEGLWEGSLYVFDGRMGVKFSAEATDIGSCVHCQAKTSHYTNCARAECNDLIVVCADCSGKLFCPACSLGQVTNATASTSALVSSIIAAAIVAP